MVPWGSRGALAPGLGCRVGCPSEGPGAVCLLTARLPESVTGSNDPVPKRNRTQMASRCPRVLPPPTPEHALYSGLSAPAKGTRPRNAIGYREQSGSGPTSCLSLSTATGGSFQDTARRAKPASVCQDSRRAEPDGARSFWFADAFSLSSRAALCHDLTEPVIQHH